MKTFLAVWVQDKLNVHFLSHETVALQSSILWKPKNIIMSFKLPALPYAYNAWSHILMQKHGNSPWKTPSRIYN